MTTYANGSEAAWETLARRLERLLRRLVPEAAEVRCGISEFTDWHEPGSQRDGRDYLALVARVIPVMNSERAAAALGKVVETRLQAIGLDFCGEGADWSCCCGEKGWDWVADVEVGFSYRDTLKTLREAERRARDG